MAKLTLSDITSGHGSTTLYNANNTLLEAAVENTLSRDGSSPNTMGSQLDMNSNYIINVPSPNDPLHTANKAYVDSLLSGTTDTGSAQLRVDLASSADGSTGGSIVGVYDPSNVFSASDVTAILLEIISDLAATGSGASGASTIGLEDAVGYYAAADVEGAFKELKPVGLMNLKGFADGAGAVDVITANFTPDVSLTDGVIVGIKAFGQITSIAPTFAPDGLTAKAIVKGDNEALVLENITSANQTLLLQYDATLDKWILLNPRQPKFRGCLAYLNSNKSISNSTLTAINFTTESYDTDTIHDNSTNNTRVTVPTGVTRVQLTAHMRFAADASGLRDCNITKNGGNFVGGSGTRLTSPDGSAVENMVATTAVITVVGGDYFELSANQTSGGSLDVQGSSAGNETWLAMEIIE